jgi:hypothetical protein
VKNLSPWAYAEGINGDGEKPEWFKDSKYKSVADQAKAYTDLESKLGAFTGAPEEYEVSMPEGIDGEFVEGDPLMSEFQEWAKNNQVNQGAFTDLVHMFVRNEQGAYAKEQQDIELELSALGDNAKQRIQNMNDFAKANLSEEHYQGLLAATTSAQAVEAVEALIAMTRAPKIPTTDAEVDTGISHSDLKARMADPRYQSDPEFRKETSKLYERKFGSSPSHTTIG